MAFFAKLASARIPGSEVALIRFLVGLVPVLLIPAIRRRSFEWTRLDLLVLRGVFGGTAVLFYFLAIAPIPGGTATSTDRKLGFERVEEHCRRCGGHLGLVRCGHDANVPFMEQLRGIGP